MSPELLVFGEINPDIVVTGVGSVTFGQREDLTGATTMTVGSSVAILACAAARLGVPTGIVGVVGPDAFGAFMLERLRERGVATDRVRTVPGGRTGSSVILVRAADVNDRHILTDAGVMGELRAGDVDLDALTGVRHLHVGSWFLQTGATADLPDLLQRARDRGLTTSVDPNDDPARRWDSGLPSALGAVDVLFCNESEACGLAGTPDPQQAARELLRRLPAGGTVVLKCGPDGAYALTEQDVLHVPAPSTAVVDTVGAGDTLAAAYLCARLRSAAPQDALRLAVAAGTLSTRASGGVDAQPTLPEAAELSARLPVRPSPAGQPPADKDTTP